MKGFRLGVTPKSNPHPQIIYSPYLYRLIHRRRMEHQITLDPYVYSLVHDDFSHQVGWPRITLCIRTRFNPKYNDTYGSSVSALLNFENKRFKRTDTSEFHH